MCNVPEIINFVNGRQYKSISYIEKLNNLSTMKDLNYDYDLNLQTNAKLSNTVNIFLSIDDIRKCIVEPLSTLIKKKNLPKQEPIIVSTKNYITPHVFSHYKLCNLLADGYLRDKAKRYGAVEYLTMKFTIEDKRFIKIESLIHIRWFLFKFAPKFLQPKPLVLSLDEAEELIIMIEGTII